MWVAASAIHKRPAATGFFCQDRVRCLVRNKVAILCVADGLGSCRFSHVGAYCAVRYFAQTALDLPVSNRLAKQQWWDDHIRRFQNAMLALAQVIPCSVSDLASTLIMVRAYDSGMDAYRVGDGFAVARFQTGTYQSLFEQTRCARDVTKTIVEPNVRADVFDSNRVPRFMMCSSDGLYHLTFSGQHDRPHLPFFEDLEKECRSVGNLAQYLQCVLRACAHQDPSDDKGVAVLLQK